jgi:hypothetical protein
MINNEKIANKLTVDDWEKIIETENKKPLNRLIRYGSLVLMILFFPIVAPIIFIFALSGAWEDDEETKNENLKSNNKIIVKTIVNSIMSEYEPIESNQIGEGAQIVDGQWFISKYGSETLSHILENIKEIE